MSPLVSIIIPTYNRAHIISDTLNSVLAQTYSNWECIVVDDGSTDNTDAILAGFIEKDNRFQFLHRPANRLKAASTCRNIGFENSKGSYIQYLDSDDLISENKIEEQIKILNNTSNYSIATCRWGRFSTVVGEIKMIENVESYQSFDSVELFLNALANSMGYFPPHAYLIKKDIIRKVGLWNEYLTINDDGEFMMRVIANTDKVYFAPNAVAFYRLPINNNLSSHNRQIQKFEDELKSWELVESYLKIRFKQDSILYVETMKDYLYVNVKNNFPELIKKHSFFFKRQIKADPYVFYIYARIKNRIKKKLKSLF